MQVSVEITNDELTDKERTELIKGAKSLLQDIFAKNPDAEVVVVDDTHTETDKADEKEKGSNIINFSKEKLRRKGQKR